MFWGDCESLKSEKKEAVSSAKLLAAKVEGEKKEVGKPKKYEFKEERKGYVFLACLIGLFWLIVKYNLCVI